jgi:acetyl esterase
MSGGQQFGTDGLDPDIRRFVQAMQQAYGRFPQFDSMSLPERRRAAEQVRAPWRQGGPEMWRSQDLNIARVRARIHIPTAAPALGTMLYLHGGGWTMFSIDTHDRLMREYAARAGVIVVGIDYSLAPESKFPAALSEVVAVIEWLRTEGAAFGIAKQRLAIGGDSAGANLSVAAALQLRDSGRLELRALLLNYGAFSAECTASFERFDGPRYMLTVDEMSYFWRNYVRAPADMTNPLVMPLLADLRGLPPAHLTVAGCDILTDGNKAMAARLTAASVPTELHVYEGATHSFLEAMSISPLAERAIETGAQWLHHRLATD